MYASCCCAIKRQDKYKMTVVDMRMLKRLYEKIRKNGIKNEDIRVILKVTPIENKMREKYLIWFGYTIIRHVSAPIRNYENFELKTKNKD